MPALALGEEEREGEGTSLSSTKMIYQWPGFLFSPSDEELVDHYLIKNNTKTKTKTKTDPWGIIREFDVYSKDPWDLPGDFLHGPNKNEELFFTPRRCKSARGNGSRADRTAGSGYWHSNSNSKIHCSSGWVAHKTSLTFKIKDARNAGKWVGTDWIMQEYLLLLPPAIGQGNGNGNGFQEKALCKVYNKKKKKGMKQVEEGSWSLPPPPPSKRARIEVEDEDEVVHHQEIEEEEGDVGSAIATAVHQETQEEGGDVGAAAMHQEAEGEEDVASASGAAMHQETEEEEGNVGSASVAAVHQVEEENISQPMSHLESPSTSTAQEAAAQPQRMEALAQAQAQGQISESSDVFSSLDDIYPLDEIYRPPPNSDFTLQDQFLTFQNSSNEMEADAQFQISEEASAASDVFPPLDSSPPNSDFTQIAQNKEMETQAQTQTQVEVSEEDSDVFPPLDDIYCAPPNSNFALADQPLWDWDSFSFGVGGDMGMYSACGFAQEAPQLLPPPSHSSNPVNAA